jgi:hypothetical protein
MLHYVANRFTRSLPRLLLACIDLVLQRQLIVGPAYDYLPLSYSLRVDKTNRVRLDYYITPTCQLPNLTAKT